ncbi:microtubule-binding calmodulin-regulated spectrin-associated protein [Pycnococcus provasolii]
MQDSSSVHGVAMASSAHNVMVDGVSGEVDDGVVGRRSSLEHPASLSVPPALIQCVSPPSSKSSSSSKWKSWGKGRGDDDEEKNTDNKLLLEDDHDDDDDDDESSSSHADAALTEEEEQEEPQGLNDSTQQNSGGAVQSYEMDTPTLLHWLRRMLAMRDMPSLAYLVEHPHVFAAAIERLGHQTESDDLGACLEAAGLNGASRLVADMTCVTSGDSDRQSAASSLLSRLYRLCYFDFLRSCADPNAAAQALVRRSTNASLTSEDLDSPVRQLRFSKVGTTSSVEAAGDDAAPSEENDAAPSDETLLPLPPQPQPARTRESLAEEALLASLLPKVCSEQMRSLDATTTEEDPEQHEHELPLHELPEEEEEEVEEEEREAASLEEVENENDDDDDDDDNDHRHHQQAAAQEEDLPLSPSGSDVSADTLVSTPPPPQQQAPSPFQQQQQQQPSFTPPQPPISSPFAHSNRVGESMDVLAGVPMTRRAVATMPASEQAGAPSTSTEAEELRAENALLREQMTILKAKLHAAEEAVSRATSRVDQHNDDDIPLPASPPPLDESARRAATRARLGESLAAAEAVAENLQRRVSDEGFAQHDALAEAAREVYAQDSSRVREELEWEGPPISQGEVELERPPRRGVTNLSVDAPPELDLNASVGVGTLDEAEVSLEEAVVDASLGSGYSVFWANLGQQGAAAAAGSRRRRGGWFDGGEAPPPPRSGASWLQASGDAPAPWERPPPPQPQDPTPVPAPSTPATPESGEEGTTAPKRVGVALFVDAAASPPTEVSAENKSPNAAHKKMNPAVLAKRAELDAKREAFLAQRRERTTTKLAPTRAQPADSAVPPPTPERQHPDPGVLIRAELDSATAAVDALLAEHAALANHVESSAAPPSHDARAGASPLSNPASPLGREESSSTPSAAPSRVKLYRPLSSSRLSNKKLVHNALRTVCLAGRADAPILEEVVMSLEDHSRTYAEGGGVFVILLKDKSLTRYSALYAVRDTKLGLMAKLHGVGPGEVNGGMLVVSLKYDSGGRRFVEMNGAKGLPANACAIKLRR